MRKHRVAKSIDEDGDRVYCIENNANDTLESCLEDAYEFLDDPGKQYFCNLVAHKVLLFQKKVTKLEEWLASAEMASAVLKVYRKNLKPFTKKHLKEILSSERSLPSNTD